MINIIVPLIIILALVLIVLLLSLVRKKSMSVPSVQLKRSRTVFDCHKFPDDYNRQIVIKAEGLKAKLFDSGNTMNFEIYKGDFVYVIGASGIGKTVLLRMLGGYDKNITGTLEFFFMNCTWKKKDLYLKSRIGYVPQEASLYGDLTPAELLKGYTHLLTETSSEDDAMEILKELGIIDKANKKIGSLSGGERRRVSLAIELLKHPDILILDEPDSGLDPSSRAKLYEILKTINERDNKTIILSTHNQDIINSVDNKKEEIFDFLDNSNMKICKIIPKPYTDTEDNEEEEHEQLQEI